MKKIHLIYAACLLVGMGACAASVQKQVKDNSDVWKARKELGWEPLDVLTNYKI